MDVNTSDLRDNIVFQHLAPSFKIWAMSGLLFVYFQFFQTKITIFTTNYCVKCLSSIWCWDANPGPSEHESYHITTRPGLLL